jgi:hypothetical protein
MTSQGIGPDRPSVDFPDMSRTSDSMVLGVWLDDRTITSNTSANQEWGISASGEIGSSPCIPQPYAAVPSLTYNAVLHSNPQNEPNRGSEYLPLTPSNVYAMKNWHLPDGETLLADTREYVDHNNFMFGTEGDWASSDGPILGAQLRDYDDDYTSYLINPIIQHLRQSNSHSVAPAQSNPLADGAWPWPTIAVEMADQTFNQTSNFDVPSDDLLYTPAPLHGLYLRNSHRHSESPGPSEPVSRPYCGNFSHGFHLNKDTGRHHCSDSLWGHPKYPVWSWIYCVCAIMWKLFVYLINCTQCGHSKCSCCKVYGF